MARQIIKQPNGKYCIFSSIVDNITHYNMTPEEIIEVWAEESRKEITKKVNDIIYDLSMGKRPYYQFTMSYGKMLNTIEAIHGKDDVNEVRELIEKE